MSKRFQTQAALPEQPQTANYAAGYYLTPARLAAQRVKAILAILIGLAALVAGGYAALLTEMLWYMLAAALVTVLAAVYAISLLNDLNQVRAALWSHLWQQETASGRDLDGDGHVGQPVGHVVHLRSRHGSNGHIILPNLGRPPVIRPLIGFPAQPKPITPDDVIYILNRAVAGRDESDQTIGLVFRQWEGHRLPGGAVIDRGTWSGVLDGLIHWRFAVQRRQAGRRIVELRTDIEVEDMIRAVRLAIREEANRGQ